MEEEILRDECFLEEEQRCLNYCLNNLDECDEDEIDAREEYIAELIEKIENKKKNILNYLK